MVALSSIKKATYVVLVGLVEQGLDIVGGFAAALLLEVRSQLRQRDVAVAISIDLLECTRHC